MSQFDEFVVGTRIESANNNQPGEVIAIVRDNGFQTSGRDWFEVKWDRHPNGKTRIYHRDPWYNVFHDDFGGWPSIIESEPTNEELASDRLVFVDPIADAKDSLRAAFAEAATLNGDDVFIDVNKLFLTLANNGWSYSKGE